MTVAATTISTTTTSNLVVAAPPIVASEVGDLKFRARAPMASNNKPPLKSLRTNNIGDNTSPSTPTPRLAASQRPTSNSLHPNVTTRSPRSAARKGRAETICSPDSELHVPAARPSSSLEQRPLSATESRVSMGSETPSNCRQQTTTHPAPLRQNSFTTSSNGTTPKFFHANQARPTRPSLPAKVSSTPPLSSPRTPLGQPAKFFHADSIPTSAPRSHSPTPPAPPPRLPGQPGFVNDFIQNPHAYISEFTSRSSSMVGGGSRPASVVSMTPSALPEPRSHVKFVYANGTEEILPPRRLGSEAGSAAPSPQIAQVPFSGSPTGALSPLSSPNPAANPQTQLFRSPQSSPRSSIDASTRHGRALSISSTIDMMSLLKGESTGEDRDNSKASDDDALSAKAAAKAKIKAMEEAAANARRERKVLDLEISNTSLLAINKTLERQMRKQTAELRRYRRLSRTGRLASLSNGGKKRKNGKKLLGQLSDGDDEEVSGSESASGESASDVDGEAESEGENGYSPDEDGDDEKEDSEEKAGGTTAVGLGEKKDKAPEAGRLDLDLSKHQALLEASAKMNVSLKRCQYITEQLIKEGKKALEYKVQPSDVHLGGRVLIGDNDEEFEGETEDNEDSRMENAITDKTGYGESEGSEGGEYSHRDQDSQDEEDDEEHEGGSSGVHDEDDETSGGEDIYPFRDADRVMLPRLAGYVGPTT